VEGLIEEISSSAHDMLNILKQGALRRHTGATLMNKESSRSHSVLSTTIETKVMKNGLFNIKISKFHIIDLAGSERAKNTEAVGSRLKEAGMINKSLSTLGNVINSLVDVSLGKSRHVHYRDSKLTFLLRDSLGGNSKTLIIANVSPASVSFGETLSTLKFAQRAKLIKNKAIINEDSSGTVAILKDEIKRLKLAMTKMKLNLISKNKQICSKCSDKVEKRGNLNINESSISADYNTEDLSLCKADSVNDTNTQPGTTTI
jgi:Kinesin motor domain